MVDPMMVEALRFPPPHNIRQLQGLRGKDNLLHLFIVNYANLTKGFMHILKKDSLFIWDEQARNPSMLLRNIIIGASVEASTLK
jgi:hypothetical protein